MNVIKEIAYSYAQLVDPDNAKIEYFDDDFNEDNYDSSEYEDFIEEMFEGDVIGWTVSEIIGWYGQHVTVGNKSQKTWVKENNLKMLEQEGGGEGGSEYCSMVFSWKDKVYKIEYSYYSHEGHNYEGVEDTIREVVAAQKTITVWE